LSYDDWCIAQMANDLGKADEAQLFTKRSQYYKNVWDPKTQFFRSKQPDGTYYATFDPREVVQAGNVAGGYYTEANAWEYAFAALQDVPGMIQLYGGNKPFMDRLDQFFYTDCYVKDWRVDTTGFIGQYSHGNEPDEATPYLYSLAGAPYRTAQIVREIQLTQYDNTQEGLDGNDDCGQISSWYVWSALGLYPTPELEQDLRAARARDREALLGALKEEGLLPGAPGSPGEPFTLELAHALHLYLARSSAVLAAIQIEDLLGMTEPVNVPGTHHEYPNWQRKLTHDLEELEIREDLDRRFAAISLAREAPPGHG